MKQILLISFLCLPFFLTAQTKKADKKMILTALLDIGLPLNNRQNPSLRFLSLSADWQCKTNFSFGFHFKSKFIRAVEKDTRGVNGDRKNFRAELAFGPSLNWHQPAFNDGQWEIIWLSRISTRLSGNRGASNGRRPFTLFWDDLQLATHPGLIYHISDRLSAIGLLGEISFTHLGPLARSKGERSNVLNLDFGLDQIKLGIRLNLRPDKHQQKS